MGEQAQNEEDEWLAQRRKRRKRKGKRKRMRGRRTFQLEPKQSAPDCLECPNSPLQTV